eukprot:SAG22_NODE_2392_length_2623_cov_5.797544_4_plen_82_part_00
MFVVALIAHAGDDISKEVFNSIKNAGAFLVFGTSDYGVDTGNPTCTAHELKYAQVGLVPTGSLVLPSIGMTVQNGENINFL